MKAAMFAKLTGIIDTLGEDHAIVDVAGVGYLVFASARTLDQMAPGAPVRLLIDTQVGEDHIRLFGFLRAEEQRWFRLLQAVQGVGARVALAVLSVLPPEQLAPAIAAQDKASVGRASGVGPKLAQRIVTELKDKAGALTFALPAGAPETGAAASAASAGSDAARDAASALVNLGYRPVDAHAGVAAALGRLGPEAAFDTLVRAALKELGR